MYSRIREQFSTSALILSIIALVLAVAGGAYAAKQAGLNSKQKKQVVKIAEEKAGTGPAGAKGDPGAPGKNGTNGTNGTNGKDGNSAVVKEIPIGEPGKCNKLGGAEVGVAGGPSTNICNGEEGPEGSPWTAGGTLPPGAVETGAWAFSTTEATENIKVPISFAIPLKESLTAAHVHLQGELGFLAICGGFEKPEPKPGELCVYKAGFQHNSEFGLITEVNGIEPGTNVTGAMLNVTPAGEEEPVSGQGAWAVQGCSTEVGVEPQCP